MNLFSLFWTTNQLFVVYLFVVLLLTNIVKEYHLLDSFYNWLIKRIKSKKLLVIIISMLSGVLPIPNRIIASTAILDTIAPKKKSKFGILNYLATHHYYLWSPLESSIVIILGTLSITYLTFISYTWPLLLVYLCYMLYYLVFKIQTKDITINKPKKRRKTKPSFLQAFKRLNWKLLILTVLVIALSTVCKLYIGPLIGIIKLYTLLPALGLSFLASFIMGSSAKYAGIVGILCGVFGLQYLPLFFAFEYVAYLLSPMHKCVIISINYFNTKITEFYKVLIPLSVLLIIIGILLVIL